MPTRSSSEYHAGQTAVCQRFRSGASGRKQRGLPTPVGKDGASRPERTARHEPRAQEPTTPAQITDCSHHFSPMLINHAYYNAVARNLRCLADRWITSGDRKKHWLRYLRRNQTGDDGGAPVGVRPNRGILNANGEHDPPAGDSGRNGSQRESPTRNEARPLDRAK